MLRQNNKPATNIVERITFEKNKISLFQQNVKDTCVLKIWQVFLKKKLIITFNWTFQGN